MTSIFAFLKRLFSGRPAPTRPSPMSLDRGEAVVATPAVEPEVAPEPPAPEPPPEPSLPPTPAEPTIDVGEPAGADDEEEEEPDDLPPEEDFEDDDPSAPDPFVSPDAAPIEALSPDAVSQQRAEAMALALTGEHRVFLAESAGPGTLAEALNLLAQQGKVEAAFHEGEDDGPYLLYRLIDPADVPPRA